MGTNDATAQDPVAQDPATLAWDAFRTDAWRQLRALIEQARMEGLDQKQIAARLGMDPAQLSRTLSGRQTVTLRSMFGIARALGQTMEIRFVPRDDASDPGT